MKYTIKKGKHFAQFTINRLWPFLFGRTLKGTFKFSKECWHPLESIKYTGWNKLTGLSGLLIHRNSARLVWMPHFDNPGRIIIAAYIYSDGVRRTEPLCSVNTDCDNGFTIVAGKGLWTFYIKDRTTSLPGHIPALRFRAYPYFGGRSTAPNDMIITLK